MRGKSVSLLINPRTGQNVAKLPDILAVLSAAGWKTNVVLKEYGRHVMELANEAVSNRDDIVIAYGGDGTLNQAVNGMMSVKKRRSALAVLPGGTTNVWAGEIGVPNEPVKAALMLVNSEVRKVDVGRAEIKSITFPDGREVAVKKNVAKDSNGVRHHFLLMAGLGIDAAVMNNVSKPLKYRLGALAVGVSAAKEIPAQHSFPIEIQAAGAARQDQPLWKGEAIQVVIGNTRRYARVAEMTPDAYIDDGILDFCIITAGDALSTMQQVASLVLRLKPDNTTAEYFHGPHMLIKVPATVPFQVDGSPVDLKDYLNKSDYKALLQMENTEQVMVTYQFDSMPHALETAIPCTYNEELFEHPHDHEDAKGGPKRHHGNGKSPVAVQTSRDDTAPQTSIQEHSVAVLSKPESQVEHGQLDEQAKKREEEVRKTLPEIANALLEHGRKVTIIAKAPNPEKKNTYIIAGTVQQSTGELSPVAVVVNGKTTIYDREGKRMPDISMVEELQEGMVVVVEGKKNLYSVIRATRMVV